MLYDSRDSSRAWSTAHDTRVVWKIYDLAYNGQETWDKQLLGRDLDRSRCHLHTNLTLLVAAHGSMDIGCSIRVCCHSVLGSRVAIKEASQECDDDTSSCPGPYPMATCPEFHIGWRLNRELFTLPVCCPYAHGAMGCDQKSFIILVVWRWHQLLSDSLTKGCLSRVSRRLGRKLFRPSTYRQLVRDDVNCDWKGQVVHRKPLTSGRSSHEISPTYFATEPSTLKQIKITRYHLELGYKFISWSYHSPSVTVRYHSLHSPCIAAMIFTMQLYTFSNRRAAHLVTIFN